MRTMNQTPAVDLPLRKFMTDDDGWGRDAGREVFPRLLKFVEANPGNIIFRVCLKDVRRVDISFASETIIELAKKFRGQKGFCFIDLNDDDQRENWEAAARRAKQPMMDWTHGKAKVLGLEPTQGTIDALKFALARPETRASEYSSRDNDISITNASTKFKQLWEQGFLLRRESVAESGGVEFNYIRIA